LVERRGTGLAGSRITSERVEEERMTRRLAEEFIAVLLTAILVGAAVAPAHGQASEAPPAQPQPVDTTPDRRDGEPKKSQEQEKPRMQWEEQTLFASIVFHVRSIGA
jgi:hypothetical protein